MKRVAFSLMVTLAACGGGASSSLPGSASTATPSVAPTASATPTAAPALSAAPPSLAISSAAAQDVTITETGYSGTFAESDTCNPFSGVVASVSVASSSAGKATYAVTPLGAGTCAVTATDTAGRATSVNVTVSTAAIVVQ